MHWLADQLAYLRAKADQHAVLRDRRDIDGAPSQEEIEARRGVRLVLERLVDHLARHEAVVASFAAHDGLLVHGHGERHVLEAMAAMSQAALEAARSAGSALSLGGVEQVLLSGLDRKFVLFSVGEVTFGVLAPTDADLRTQLATPPSE